MHQLLLQSWDAITPLQLGAPPCVVARRCGVMHVFNNSPLAPCVLAHLPFRVNVYKCARWPMNRSPARCYCMPFPSGNQAAVWYPTPRLLTKQATFFFSVSFCFCHVLPSSPFTPRLLSSHFLLALMGFLPLCLNSPSQQFAPVFAYFVSMKTPCYESYKFTLLNLSFWIKRKRLFGKAVQF